MFDVEYDRGANCLNIVVKGFWEREDVAIFGGKMRSKARTAKAICGDFNAFVESLEFPVQAMDVAALLTHIMRGAMVTTTGRAAVVVGSQLNKTQAERTLVHPRVRIFLSTEKARLWLATPAGG